MPPGLTPAVQVSLRLGPGSLALSPVALGGVGTGQWTLPLLAKFFTPSSFPLQSSPWPKLLPLLTPPFDDLPPASHPQVALQVSRSARSLQTSRLNRLWPLTTQFSQWPPALMPPPPLLSLPPLCSLKAWALACCLFHANACFSKSTGTPLLMIQSTLIFSQGQSHAPCCPATMLWGLDLPVPRMVMWPETWLMIL